MFSLKNNHNNKKRQKFKILKTGEEGRISPSQKFGMNLLNGFREK